MSFAHKRLRWFTQNSIYILRGWSHITQEKSSVYHVIMYNNIKAICIHIWLYSCKYILLVFRCISLDWSKSIHTMYNNAPELWKCSTMIGLYQCFKFVTLSIVRMLCHWFQKHLQRILNQSCVRVDITSSIKSTYISAMSLQDVDENIHIYTHCIKSFFLVTKNPKPHGKMEKSVKHNYSYSNVKMFVMKINTLHIKNITLETWATCTGWSPFT